ncbi:quaternary ammonium compound efflux SMR transporter SugE [Heliobacterium chlorum]|uniref:Quaternary ammonium compound efflux SMR transporter SugE n=1 Tax=Heliobacterium chlorum TaxID=2698 RepID=A0ABR7T7B9_HELCL|nr:quaternary ammonium compound efflux SMR transporter SugE [Heliobacterium chlorum]MBC9786665.1 quaternary ammonium compound efflux SMR transporter SugE [Heliobacterium chlorum]
MAWTYLVIAGIFEVVWAIGLKYSQGFTRLYPSLITAAGMAVSFYFLALASKTLPIGTAYAVWTGIGAVGAVILGIVLFQEPRDFPRMVFLAMILIGIIGLKFTSASS